MERVRFVDDSESLPSGLKNGIEFGSETLKTFGKVFLGITLTLACENRDFKFGLLDPVIRWAQRKDL